MSELRQPPALGEALEVATKQDLDVRSGSLSREPHLAALPAGQRLTHHGALEVETEIREEEVGRKGLADLSVLVTLEHERVGLVLPRDAVCVEDAGECTLDGVRELGRHPHRVTASGHS